MGFPGFKFARMYSLVLVPSWSNDSHICVNLYELIYMRTEWIPKGNPCLVSKEQTNKQKPRTRSKRHRAKA